MDKRACYHILQSNGPNNDFKNDLSLVEYCTWTDNNYFYYLCKWLHSRLNSSVQNKYDYGYIVHTVENPRTYWKTATTLYGYTRPERYIPPLRPSSVPSFRNTLEDIIQAQGQQALGVDDCYQDDYDDNMFYD